MASFSAYPQKYLDLKEQSSKTLSIVVTIEGLSDTLSIVPLYTKIRYGDAGIDYGTPGVVYGGLRLKDGNKPYLMVDGLTISQKIEPEQGKGSISLMTLKFIDKDGYLSKLISPGVLVTEPLGTPLVRVWLGYQQTSFPDDYFTVFRGYMSNTTSGAGWVSIQLSDGNAKAYGQINYIEQTTLSAGIDATTTTIPVNKTDGFFQQILGPSGSYDPAVTTYIVVDDEVMTYPATGITGPTTFSVLSRGGSHSRGTPNIAHDPAATVLNSVQLQDNAITLALKIYLSGWNGPYVTGIKCQALGTALDPDAASQANAVVLDQTVNAVTDLGLVPGDYITISGSTAGNDGTYVIESIADHGGDANRLLYLTQDLNFENPASAAALAFRSQFDTLPIGCGAQMSPKEVDVATHIAVRDNFFSSASATLQIYFTDTSRAKDTIEAECYLPLGIYSLTRYGQLSLGVTKPPIAGESTQFLNIGNIIDPDKITVTRATNNRRFYNEIQYSLDLADNDVYQDVQAIIDTNSLTRIGLTSVLPIPSSGLRSQFGGDQLALSRGQFLLNRFKNCAYEIKVTVLWKVGSLIEVGDVIALQDDGTLKITNFQTGERNLGTQLFEVIQRSMEIKSGRVALTLLSQMDYNLNQRFATIAPSSLVSNGSTTTTIQIQDSFGAKYPGNEKKKWEKLTGNDIRVHNADYSVSGVTMLVGFDPLDRYKMLVSPALSFTPAEGYVVDLAPYSSSASKDVNANSKLLYDFMSPTLTIVTGISGTQFTLSSGDAARIVVGQTVAVRNSDWSTLGSGNAFSPEQVVLSVVGTTVTVAASLGFTPSAGQKVEYVGFADGQGAYRYL